MNWLDGEAIANFDHRGLFVMENGRHGAGVVVKECRRRKNEWVAASSISNPQEIKSQARKFACHPGNRPPPVPNSTYKPQVFKLLQKKVGANLVFGALKRTFRLDFSIPLSAFSSCKQTTFRFTGRQAASNSKKGQR